MKSVFYFYIVSLFTLVAVFSYTSTVFAQTFYSEHHSIYPWVQSQYQPQVWQYQTPYQDPFSVFMPYGHMIMPIQYPLYQSSYGYGDTYQFTHPQEVYTTNIFPPYWTGNSNYVVGYYGESHDSNDDIPDARTLSTHNITTNSARLRGEVDMNDFRNGRVFFVYGEDRDDIEDVERERRYSDIDQQGDDLRKILVDNDLDNEESYSVTVFSLDGNTRIYTRVCVEYENDNGNDRVECGNVEDFRTQ